MRASGANLVDEEESPGQVCPASSNIDPACHAGTERWIAILNLATRYLFSKSGNASALQGGLELVLGVNTARFLS